MKTSALPILAVATMALSTAGCANWMGGQHPQPAAAQTSMAQPANQAAQVNVPPAMSPQFVSEIQNSLNAQGYKIGVDGVYGASTQTAIQQFQRRQNLNATGQVDAPTLAALGLNPAKVAGAGAPEAQPQAAPGASRGGGNAVAAAPGPATRQGIAQPTMQSIQQSLKDRGYKIGKVDGKWGPQTRSALRAFQRDEHLPASGRIDEHTLAALGIGTPEQQTGQMPPNARQPQR